jgi:predicted ribosomally synthesized peptide with SipW-like signal peptide
MSKVQSFESEVIMVLFMGICFGLAALALLGGAVWAYFSQQRKMESRVAAAGSVVELTTGVGASGHASMFYPEVEFTASSGEKIKFRSDFGSRPAGHKIGQSVTVRYDPADPKKAEIESVMNLWLVPLILVFMGGVAGCLAITFLGFFGLGVSP